jgi:hypothetical protein
MSSPRPPGLVGDDSPAANRSAAPAPTALPPGKAALVRWLALAAVILLVKTVLFWADHTPMFFLGDSVAYINTAKWGWIPPDRSFLYGWIIRIISLWPGTLTPLLVAQTLATAAAAVLCALILRRNFAAPRAIAALMALLCAVEPLQLLYERYVMTEAFSLLAFALFVTFALAYLHRPSLRRLLLMQIAGVLVISFRVSFLPMIEAATLLVPLLPLTGRPATRRWMRIAGHLVLSCVLFVGLHGTYKRLYAAEIQSYLPGAPPAYYYDNGFHLLCFVAPIVQPSDFPHPEKAAEVFRLAFDLKDPDLRGKQRWWPGGLIANVQAAYPDHLEANRLAEQTAWNAVRRDPWGEFRLSWYSFRDYWNLQHLRLGMLTDQGGDRELPADLLSVLRNDFHIEGAGLPHLSTLSNRYFFAAWPWYLVLLLLPVPLLVLLGIVPAPHRPAAILLFVFAALQITIIAACSISPTVRFLHAVAWLSMLTAGIALTRLCAPQQKARPQAPLIL